MAAESSVSFGLDAIFGAVLTVVGWVVAAIRRDQRDLQKSHEHLAASLPETYARRDDVKEDLAEIKEQHKVISQKLDTLLLRSMS